MGQNTHTNLIAAAPELLEALKQARSFVVSQEMYACNLIDLIDSAIAKAEGGDK